MKYVGNGRFVPDDNEDFDEVIQYDFVDDEYMSKCDLSTPEWKARLYEMDKDPAFLADIERERKMMKLHRTWYGDKWMARYQTG